MAKIYIYNYESVSPNVEEGSKFYGLCTFNFGISNLLNFPHKTSEIIYSNETKLSYDFVKIRTSFGSENYSVSYNPPEKLVKPQEINHLGLKMLIKRDSLNSNQIEAIDNIIEKIEIDLNASLDENSYCDNY